MNLGKQGIALISLMVLLWQPASVFGCGFYETERDYQALMFRAILPQMDCMQPFVYDIKTQWGGELNSDPNNHDKNRNCKEWLSQCDSKVKPSDVYALLYKTDGDIFIKFVNKLQANKELSRNTFMIFLLQKRNKELLDYLLIAKQIEAEQSHLDSRFEDWDFYDRYKQTDTKNINASVNKRKTLFYEVQSRISTSASTFLKERYAFQLCKLAFELNMKPDAGQLYNRYFQTINPKSLMSTWACLYKASGISGSEEANRCLIQVFNACDEKKFRCVQLYNDSFIPERLTAKEKSTLFLFRALRNPARAIHQIEQVYHFNPKNQYVSFLIVREINKIEDWLTTPLFFKKYSITNSDPFKKAYHDPDYSYNPENDDVFWKSFRAKNRNADLLYLKNIKRLTEKLLQNSHANERDFYSVALAHICLLEENSSEAIHYLNSISPQALPSIQLQSKIESTWLAIKTSDVSSAEFEKIFLNNITDIARLKYRSFNNNDIMYTLTLALANEYLKTGNIVYGNLVRFKSDIYRERRKDISYDPYWSFTSLNYFDANASTDDMDKLIALAVNRNKTAFQNYICSGTIPELNYCYDMKGTLAFRQHNLKLAKQSFMKVQPDFWLKSDLYNGSLKENPFIPKGLMRKEKRNFNYKFNKAEFISTLIDLEKKAQTDKQHAADYYNQLGNAFFNTSYWGNAFMMTRYAWSCNDLFYTRTGLLPAWMNDYMQAGRARKYYLKAYKTAVNNEQKAYASLMLHYIYRLNYGYLKRNNDNKMAHEYGRMFYTYKSTNTYKTLYCPLLKDYLY